MTELTAIWLDMQLPPRLCGALSKLTGMNCKHLADLGMHRAFDEEVFHAAREANAIILTKDADFARLLQQHGPPPSVIWLRCGNCSVAALQDLLEGILPSAIELIHAGEPLVEIENAPGSRSG